MRAIYTEITEREARLLKKVSKRLKLSEPQLLRNAMNLFLQMDEVEHVEEVRQAARFGPKKSSNQPSKA